MDLCVFVYTCISNMRMHDIDYEYDGDMDIDRGDKNVIKMNAYGSYQRIPLQRVLQ